MFNFNLNLLSCVSDEVCRNYSPFWDILFLPWVNGLRVLCCSAKTDEAESLHLASLSPFHFTSNVGAQSQNNEKHIAVLIFLTALYISMCEPGNLLENPSTPYTKLM